MVIREFAPPNNVPLGPCYIASYLESHGHRVDICDLNGLRWIDQRREKWLSETVKGKKYDFVGLSGLIVTAKEHRRVLDFLYEIKRELGDPFFVAGGGLATSVPQFVFQYLPEIDIVAIGEGEETMLDIADGMDWEDIPGIWWKHPPDEVYVKNSPRPFIGDLDSLPFPAWDKVPVDKVYVGHPIWGGIVKNSSGINYKAKKSMNTVVSRGCPYECGFCAHGVIWGKRYRMRSPGNVIAEMRELKRRYGIDFVGFVDDNTTAIRRWTMEFCDQLIDSGLDIKWGCSARVNAVDPEMLKLMKQAGCEWIGYGVESACQKTLDAMNKQTTPEMAARAIRWTREAGMWANTTYIIGYEGETEEDFKQTADFMIDNKAVNSVFYATAYPGTPFYERNKEKILEVYGSEKEYILSLGDATEFTVNFSEMSTERMKELRAKAMAGERI